MFRINFTPSKCKMLPKDWIGSKPNLDIAAEEVSAPDRFSCWDCCISSGGRMPDEASSPIQKARLAFTK